MLDLDLNSEELHSIFVEVSAPAGTKCYCASHVAEVSIPHDTDEENVHRVHGTGSEEWTIENGTDHADAELDGSFLKNGSDNLIFSGVFECACFSDDEPVNDTAV